MYSQPPPTSTSFAQVASTQPKKPETAEAATQTDKKLAISLIEELFEMPDFRSEVLKLVVSVVNCNACSNVSELMHVSVENDVSTNVNVCKSVDYSSLHQAYAVIAKSVPTHEQKNRYLFQGTIWLLQQPTVPAKHQTHH